MIERQHLYRKGKQPDGTHRYVYFRHPETDALTPLPRDETSGEFAEAYNAILATVTVKLAAPTIRAERPAVAKPGSISWIIERYMASDKFLAMADKTRKGYRIQLDLMKEIVGHSMLHDITPQGVDHYSAKIVEMRSASVADVHTTLISNLWNFAKRFEEFKRGDKHCPTLGRTRHYEHDGEGHLAWPDEVIDKFDGWAEPHLRQVRMGLMYTGQRGVDVVKMKWSDYDGELINVVQEKTGEQVWLCCPLPLKRMLDTMPRVSEYIFTTLFKHTPFASADSLGGLITRHCEKIGHPDYTMHGLRKNAGMELALAGCTVPEIMAVLGHRSPKMAMFYVQQADKQRLGRSATAKRNAFYAERDAERAAAVRGKLTVIEGGTQQEGSQNLFPHARRA